MGQLQAAGLNGLGSSWGAGLRVEPCSMRRPRLKESSVQGKLTSVMVEVSRANPTLQVDLKPLLASHLLTYDWPKQATRCASYQPVDSPL